MRSERGWDVVDVLLADVNLWSSRRWDAPHIGDGMTIAGIATVAAKAPAGALVDWTSRERATIAIARRLVAAGVSKTAPVTSSA